MTRYRWYFVLGLVTLIVIISLATFQRQRLMPAATKNYDEKYNADKEISLAYENLESLETSSVISGVRTFEKKIALSFDGTTSPELLNDIIEILDTYNVKSTFFIQGIAAAENSSFMTKITKADHEIGNYTLSGQMHMEEFEETEIIQDIVLSEKILEETINNEIQLIKYNNTDLSNNILHASYASGYDNVVKSDYYLSYQSFKSFEEADNFIANIENGALISIKMTGVLSNDEYIQDYIEEDEISEDLINESNDSFEDDTEKYTVSESGIDSENKIKIGLGSKQEDITKVVEWLLMALENNDMEIETIANIQAYHDSDFDKTFANEKYNNEGDLSRVISKVYTNDWVVGYIFNGISTDKSVDDLIKYLKSTGKKVSFVVTGEDAVNYPVLIQRLVDEGHHIINGGLKKKDMSQLDYEQISFEIWKTNKILSEEFGISSYYYFPPSGKVTTTIREACNGLGMKVVTYNKNPLRTSNTQVYEVKKYFEKGLEKGDIIYLNLNNTTQDQAVFEYINNLGHEEGYTGFKISTLMAYDGSKNASVLPTYNNFYESLREQNSGELAKVIPNVYTAQPAVSYAFRYVRKTDELLKVLDVLDELNVKGSFFVTTTEVEKYTENISEIIRRGHFIYNGGDDTLSSKLSQLSFIEILHSIRTGDLAIEKLYKINNINIPYKVYMPLYTDTKDIILEAASSYGYDEVITFNRNAMKAKYKSTSAEAIVADYLKRFVSFYRGDIIYFRLDYYEDIDNLTNLIRIMTNDYVYNTTYEVVPVHELVSSDLVYEPLEERREEFHADERVRPFDLDTLLPYIRESYIGTPHVDDIYEFFGFETEELEGFDITGILDTKGNKDLFITFDDWGSDIAITKLLNVLRKHDIKAGFFIRTGNASLDISDSMTNPNLLRAIAVEGHDIGNHTFSHYIAMIDNDEETYAFMADIMAAKLEMERYVGDTDSIVSIFRMPTLAISKLGFYAIMNTGYDHIVSGQISSHDYEAKSADEIINNFTEGMFSEKVTAGSIIVMHMSDESKYTADALDVLIPYYKEQGYSFKKLSDYLK